MENTLNAKEDSKGASQILMPSREMQGNKKNVNTFSVSHSKHIHQPATFPRLNYKKKNQKNPVTQIKRRPFPFRFNAIFNREEEEEVLRYLVAAQSQCLALLQCRGCGAFSENPAGDRYVQFSPPSGVHSRLNNKL